MRWSKIDTYCIESRTHFVCKFAQGQKGGAPSIWCYEVSRKRPVDGRGQAVYKSQTTRLGHFAYGPDVEGPARKAAYDKALALAEQDLATQQEQAA